MDTPPALGQFLARLRTQRGLSIRQVAARSSTGDPYWGQVERGVKKPSRPMLVDMATALDASPSERDQLLALAGYEPVGVDQARRRIEEGLEMLALPLGTRRQILELAGVAAGVAPSGQSGHDAAASDPAPGVRTAGVAFDDLSPEDQEALLRLARGFAIAPDQVAPGLTQGGDVGAGHATHGGPAGRGRRAAGGDD